MNSEPHQQQYTARQHYNTSSSAIAHKPRIAPYHTVQCSYLHMPKCSTTSTQRRLCTVYLFYTNFSILYSVAYLKGGGDGATAPPRPLSDREFLDNFCTVFVCLFAIEP